MKIIRLIAGFGGALDVGALGWSTVCGLETPAGFWMVDTGGPSCRRTLPEAVKKAGHSTEEVRAVVLTHLHWDHIYNVDLFPNATLYVSRREYEAAFAASGSLAYHPALLRMVEARRPVLIETDETELQPSLTLRFTPGHTAGSMTAFVNCGEETWALAGDAIKTRAEIGGAAPMTVNAEESARSIRLICQKASVICPGHDCVFRLRGGVPEPVLSNDYELTAAAGMLLNGQNKLTLQMNMRTGE